jgi:hypothetical protein
MQQYGRWSDNKQAPAATIHNAIRTINLPTVTLKEGCGLSHAMEALLHRTPSLSFTFSLTIHWIYKQFVEYSD